MPPYKHTHTNVYSIRDKDFIVTDLIYKAGCQWKQAYSLIVLPRINSVN